MQGSPAHPELTSLTSSQARQCQGLPHFSDLWSAALLLPPMVLPHCHGYSLSLSGLFPRLVPYAKEGATIQELGLGLYIANGKRAGASPPQGFIAAGRCQSLQSCCCCSPASLGTVESKVQGWGCCRASMACWEASGSGLNGSASSKGTQFSSPTEKLSDFSFQLCFPYPTPAQFSFLVPLLLLPTPRAFISLPSRVSSSRLLAVIFCSTRPSASDASRPASKFGAQSLAIAP